MSQQRLSISMSCAMSVRYNMGSWKLAMKNAHSFLLQVDLLFDHCEIGLYILNTE